MEEAVFFPLVSLDIKKGVNPSESASLAGQYICISSWLSGVWEFSIFEGRVGKLVKKTMSKWRN
jgi:hypothetical protein